MLASQGLSDTYSGLRLVNPGGGALTTNSGAITGAIKVKLPTASLNSSTMIRLTIKIYEYNTGYSRTFEVGGYNYGGTNWYNWFATQSSQSGGDMTVRFGQDATSDCIWIGETSTVWQYPQVFITDVQCGYSATTQAMWASGWAISFVTAFDTVEQSTVAYRPLSSGNYNSYAPTLTGGGASGTWSINVTGSAGSVSGNSNGLAITGFGYNNQTYYQSSGTFAGYSGWAGYFISSHGDGATYYNQTIITPFWSAPKYSRQQGNTTTVGPYTFGTTENFTTDSWTATAAQTTFNTSATYASSRIEVFANGIKMVNGSDVTVTSGNQIVFAAGLASGTNVQAVYTAI